MEEVHCDHCGMGLECVQGSVVDIAYWTTDIGVRFCDACLLDILEDYPNMAPAMRVMALRLMHVDQPKKGTIKLDRVLETMRSAAETVNPEVLGEIKTDIEEMLELHQHGLYVAAMRMGQAVWKAANLVDYHEAVTPDRRFGAESRENQSRRARKSRGTFETDDGRVSATKIISQLAFKIDALGDYLKTEDLWGEYIGVLNNLGLKPRDDKLGVTFDGGRTTKGSFRATLSRLRNN